MYPNASQKEWKVKNGTKEKNLRILQLINPAVHLTSSSKEEDPKDESSGKSYFEFIFFNFLILFRVTFQTMNLLGNTLITSQCSIKYIK